MIDVPGLDISVVEGDLLRSPAFIADWDDLARHVGEPNPYYESWYLLPSLEYCAANTRIDVIAMRRNGRLIGLAPTCRSWDYYGKPVPHLAMWVHANIFNGTPLVRSGEERVFWQEFLAWSDAHCGLAFSLHLSQIPLGTDLAEALFAVCADAGRPIGIVESHERALLCSNKGSDAYRADHHSARKRKSLRRQLAKLGETGSAEFRWQRSGDDVDEWIDRFLELEALGWKGEAGSALACADDTAALFRSSLTGAAERGRAIRLALYLDGKPIAMLVNFDCDKATFGFKTAFDPAYSAYSPGVLLENEYLADLDREGFRWSDSCAAADHPVMSGMWAERRTMAKLSIATGGPLRRAFGTRLISIEAQRATNTTAREPDQ